MPGILLAPEPRSQAMKREAEEDTSILAATGAEAHPIKRARLHKHTIKHRQAGAVQSLQGAQDEVFFQSQLLRAISLSLSAQGFDAIESSAMESFRAATEAYMVRFLRNVSSSMRSTRREAPAPEDFSFALAKSRLSSSSIAPFLAIPPNPSICQPSIAIPPDISKVKNIDDDALSAILHETTNKSEARYKYAPKHFPRLPSSHTWKTTPIYQTRQEDARQLRERATQEGVMAEQALRRLTEAGRLSTKNKHAFGDRAKSGKAARSWDKVLEFVERKDSQTSAPLSHAKPDVFDMGLPNVLEPNASQDAVIDSGESTAVVNYDRGAWRALSISKT